MTITCRFILVPGNEVVEYHGRPGDTYEKALLSLGINPDIVLILHDKQSIPQDAPIKEEYVEVLSTCSRG
ncbi:MAG: thiamine S protein [Methanomicrobiales archaeon]|nr:thiamine S protein [Methanomicrobiales archaeon]NYT20484.1 thiamine S protein [Methanomicrobiales archaeon]